MIPAATPTRWRPTPDQLMILEELFVGGVKTPSASQIQRITVHLSRYGKIECKNVFYWFQNHKAREKRKLRKTLIFGKQLQEPQQQQQQKQQLFGQNYQQNTSSVLCFFEPQYGSGFLQFPQYCNPSIDFLTQGRVQGGAPPMILATDTNKNNLRVEKRVSLYSQLDQQEDDGWMTSTLIKEVGPGNYYSTNCCTTTTTTARRPLKTLQLFPINSTTSATSSTSSSSSSSPSSRCLKDQPTLFLN